MNFRPPHSGVVALALATLAAPVGAAPVAAAQDRLSYNDDIQPILAENCFACHGPDSATRKGKLRLDRREFATAPRSDGDLEPAIVPGRPEVSPLVERITTTDTEEIMPPPESHKTLQPAEIARLKRWVAEGAEYQPHWSLLAPVRPAVPAPALARGWARNPVDAFVADRLAAAGLRPNGAEDPARLLRRVTFDLTGLPPTPEELREFLRDPSPAAYDRAVDRLLASDACAEHFTRQWLDAVRYADTHGIHIDNYRSIWPYRDWVLNAYRRNLHFDRFTIEQMAGDLLPDATLEQKIASGFNRCLPTTSEGGAIAAEYEAIYAKDRVDTMSAVWLGLTTGCAACHDHKFDPITQRDFYSLTAFFRHNTMPAMDGNVSDTPPNVFVPALPDRARWTALQDDLSAARAALDARARENGPDFDRWLAETDRLAPAPADRTTRLHLPLNEAAGPIGLAGLPGARAGGPAVPQRTDGVFGPAPRINDLDLVLGPPIALRRGSAESFGLLVRVDGAPSGTLLSCLDAEAREGGWEVFLDGGKVGLRVTNGQGTIDARGVAGAPLAPGVWHHVLFSFDTASMRSRTIEVFVDGRSVANSSVSAHLPADVTPAAPLRLGSREGADGRAAATLTGGEVWVQDVRRYQRGFVAADTKALADVVATHAALRKDSAARTAAEKKLLRAHHLASADAAAMKVAAQIQTLLVEDDTIRARGGVTLVMVEKPDGEPTAHVLNRGEYSQPGDEVPAATPAVLPPLPEGVRRDRLALARWLVAPENPLTARVTANRAWQHLFGTGIVESAGDFGVTGARPSHPKLLDWLAVEFRESGWDYRHLVRLMATSATYRQSAAVTPAVLERDPDNRLLARGPRLRLEAEQLRDQALAASGLLVAKLGGRPVHPYQPEGIWEDVAMKESTTRFYRQDTGESLYRRSLYTVWKRTAPPPAMDILNAPSREVSCVRRDRTNTPLQALVTMNEPLFVEASRHLAARALQAGAGFEARLDVVSWRLLGRALAPAEREVLRRTLDAALETYRRDPAAAGRLLAVGDSPVPPELPVPELAAWTLVASQVMNLDEALTK
jgi:mono/diheme cytochrome c family protein